MQGFIKPVIFYPYSDWLMQPWLSQSQPKIKKVEQNERENKNRT